MSLHFDTVSLRNFGPYRDVSNLELTTTPTAPVVLIHGENTLGKTQLFSAIRWCLYGTFEPQQSELVATSQLQKKFNNIAAREGEDILKVTLTFTANGQSYILTRSAKCWPGPIQVTADLRIGPTAIPELAIGDEIGRLLHPQISEFFLFDAELMKRFYDRLATERERGFIRERIESVLGIPALQLAERDVSTLAYDARDRQTKASRSISEAQRLNKQLRDSKNDQERYEREKSELAEVQRDADSAISELQEKLKTVESLQADIREQEILDAQVNGGDAEESRLKVEMKQVLGDGWLAAVSGKLQGALAVIEQENSVAVQHQIQVGEIRAEVAMLSEQTRGGACPTCRQQLPPASEDTRRKLVDAEQRLAAILTKTGDLPNLELERKVRSLIDRTTVSRYREKQDQLNDLRRLQYLRRRQLDQIRDRLKGNDAAEIRSWAQQLESLEEAARNTKRQMVQADKRLSDVRSDQQRVARQIDRLPGAQPKVVLEANFFGYVEALLDKTIERYKERTREQVERSASQMFVRLIRDPHGYGGLKIAPDYQVQLLDPRGEPRETSEGGKQLVALALIGALKEAAVRGGPVVLDSPLARLDLEHRQNVLQTWVPSLGNQAVLLVQSGELTVEAAHSILGSNIAHEYRIVRPTSDPELAIIERTR
jgi:DNA sulfur modification protein DndD